MRRALLLAVFCTGCALIPARQTIHDALWGPTEDMMGCPTLQFDIDQPTYNKLLTAATSAGVVIDGDVAKFKDCTFDWRFILNEGATEGTLFVTCTSKPWMFGCGTVNDEVSKIVNQTIKGETL